MNKRDMVIAGSLSAGVLLLWLWLAAWYAKHYPPAPPSQATTQPAPTTTPILATAPSTQPTTVVATTGPTLTVGLHAVEPQEGVSQGAVLGSADKKIYAMQVYLTPKGAGVEKVILNDFKKEVKKPDPYVFQEPYADHPGTEPLATQAITINGNTINLAGAPWKLISHNDSSATYRVMVAEGNTPVAQVTKTFSLSPRNNPDEGFEMHVEASVQALADVALKVQQSINGPTALPHETLQQSGSLFILAGFTQPHQSIEIAQHMLDSGQFKEGAPPLILTDDGSKHHAAWVGEGSTYFNALVLPVINGTAGQGFSVTAKALDPTKEDRHVVLTFDSDTTEIKGSQPALLQLSVYLGPKSRDVLKKSEYYRQFPRMYDLTLVIRGGLCAFCTWNWLVDGLFWILWAFHFVFRDWGVAIICLVVLVRLILHPLTKAGQVRMMGMQKFGPEIAKLKEKYKDDKEGLNKEMMKLYQEQGYGLGAMLGCAPMFLQTPIWIALWSALQSTFELRQAPFLYGLTWIKDLAQPDGLITFSHPITLPLIFFNPTIYSINILPLLMAVATYVNQKYFMPTPPATTPEQEQTQKMTRAMSAFFPLMFYPFPSGLNIYYLTSMTLGIVESKRIRDHIKQVEEAEKAGRVFVETKATRGARNKPSTTPEPKKTGFMARITQQLAQMQQQVEQMRDEQQKKDNKGRKP